MGESKSPALPLGDGASDCTAVRQKRTHRANNYYTVSAKADKNQSVRSTFLWVK